MDKLETIMHLCFPLSCLFGKETLEVPAVPRNYYVSLFRFAALLLLCFVQAGEPMNAQPVLEEGLPPSQANLQLPTPPLLLSYHPPASASPNMGLHLLGSILQPPGAFHTDHLLCWETTSNWKQQKEAGRVRHTLSHGSA